MTNVTCSRVFKNIIMTSKADLEAVMPLALLQGIQSGFVFSHD